MATNGFGLRKAARLRGGGRQGRKRGATFISPQEFRRLRAEVIKTSQDTLATVMISPYSGRPIEGTLISKWENGVTRVPLWAARRIQSEAEKYRRRDEAASAAKEPERGD